MSILGEAAKRPDGGGDSVPSVTTASFRKDVIAESAKTPVLVDFWAPWCGPCKQLAPVLEKVVAEARGAVKLVKMNIDEDPQIAGQLGIKSIPAVIAFQNGQPVDGFMGALPESQVRAFVERLAGPTAEPGEADWLEQAAEARAQGNDGLALAIYQQAYEEDPSRTKALAGIISIYLDQGDIGTARRLLESAPPELIKDPDIALAKSSIDLAERAAAVGDLAELRRRIQLNPNDQEARFDLSIALNARGAKGDAADVLLEGFRLDRHWNDDAARRQLLQFFETWGPTDPETIAARRRLSSLMFS